MKKIINGKRYNTETAEFVAGYSNGTGRGDFRYVSEDLYRTPRGRWFVAGEGGAMSSWATPCGDNSRTGGEGIRPLNPDEAMEWLEIHEETEALEKYFEVGVEDA